MLACHRSPPECRADREDQGDQVRASNPGQVSDLATEYMVTESVPRPGTGEPRWTAEGMTMNQHSSRLAGDRGARLAVTFLPGKPE